MWAYCLCPAVCVPEFFVPELFVSAPPALLARLSNDHGLSCFVVGVGAAEPCSRCLVCSWRGPMPLSELSVSFLISNLLILVAE